MATKTTATKKTATKKVATPNIFGNIIDLIKKVIKLDEESENYEYEGLRLEVGEDGARLHDDYWGARGNAFKSLEAVEAELQKMLAGIEKAVGKTVKGIGGGYDARINDDGVTVGCTTVSFAKLDEIYKVAQEVRPPAKTARAKK